jgi:hypothetical protein
MVSFLEGVRNANKAINCFLIGGGGNILGGIARLPGGNPDFVENTTKALRRLAGCDPAEDPEPPPPQFTGGQCVGELYKVSYLTEDRLSRPDNCQEFGNPITRNDLIGGASPYIGPIGPITEVLTDAVTPGYGFQTIQVQTGGGLRFINLGGAQSRSYWKECGVSNRYSNFVVVRANGDPDDCGDPPPVYPPPAPINIDIDVTYNTDDGTEVTVTIPFIYAPITTDINGDFRIPFTFNFGDIEFSGDVNLEPNFDVTINPPTGPRGTDSPLTDLPGPDDEIPVEQAPPDERVVGVVVQSALVGEQQLTTIFTENIPQILAPRCGSVKFGYAIAGRSFWSPDIDIKDLNCFIPCPFSQGADTVAASPAPGVALNYVPIFGAPLATVADLGQTVE